MFQPLLYQIATADLVVDYDYVIVATGAQHSYFGNDAWEIYTPGLKRLVDATDIRRRILMGFEGSELAISPDAQARELTFVVVGGTQTGVEMAGAIAELWGITHIHFLIGVRQPVAVALR